MNDGIKKVAIVIDNIYGFGGTERVVSNMASMFSLNLGVDIYSIKSGENTFYDMSGANIFCASAKGYIKSIFEISKKVNEKNYTAVFVITMGKLSCFYSFISKIKGYNISLNTYVCEHVSYASYPLYVKYLKYKSSSFYKGAIVLTSDNKKWIKDRCNIPVWVIPNAAPNYENNDHAKKMNKAIFVGRLAQQKRLDKLLKCWSEFKKDDKNNWILDIVGDGEKLAELIKYRNELGLESSVNFKGKIKDTASEYRQSSLFLMTSDYEGFPMVLVEAQAYGVPCLALDCPSGPKDIIGNYGGGIIVDNEKNLVSSILYLTSHKEKLAIMAEAAFENAKRFSFDKIRNKWLELII